MTSCINVLTTFDFSCRGISEVEDSESHGRECSHILLFAGLGYHATSPRAPGYAADSILGDYSLQHDEGVELDYWDLEVLVPKGRLGRNR
jgi:hypothetical protein